MAAAADRRPWRRAASRPPPRGRRTAVRACGPGSYRGLAAEAEEEKASSLLSRKDLPGHAEASGSVIDSDDELTIWLRMMMLAR